jgi:hypothetical protein
VLEPTRCGVCNSHISPTVSTKARKNRTKRMERR